MLKVSLQMTDTKALASVVRDMAELTKEMWVPVHKTAHWARQQQIKTIGKVVNTEQKNLKPMFRYVKSKPFSVTVVVNRSRARDGISMQYFKPKQLKGGKGVSVNSYFKGGGKTKLPSSFMFPNGKNVFVRFGKGRRDYKIMRYPQTIDTYQQRGLTIDKAAIQKRLAYETRRRVRYLILRAQGKLRGKQPKAV